MKILLTLFVLFFSSLVFADDISDFQIEGISIGDSLLDYMSEDEIKREIETNKYMYEYFGEEKFGEVYLYSNNFQNYEHLSFFVKLDDKKYIINSVRGIISYYENFNECYEKQELIIKQLSLMFNTSNKFEDFDKHTIDPSGKSTVKTIGFSVNSGGRVLTECTKFEKNLKVKNNWSDSFAVMLDNEDVIDWMSAY